MKKEKRLPKRIRFRDGLGEFVAQKMKFVAEIGRQSMTNFRTAGIRQATLELKNVRRGDTGELLADHLWVKKEDFTDPEVAEALRNKRRMEFEGVVYPYSEPIGGRGFKNWHGPRYSIGEMDVWETFPKCSASS